MNGARMLVVNPWDKRIGPNRYLAELLAADRELAERACLVLPEEGEAADEYRALGCAVEVWNAARLVHIGRTRANAERVWQTHTRGVQFARQRLRARKPDIVWTNSENVWFAGMAARTLGIPHLQTVHALTLEHHWGAGSARVRGYLRWLALWDARLIAVSQTVATMLTRNGVPARRVAVVPNGLDLDKVRAASKMPLPPAVEEQLAGRSPLLVSLGRVSALKGHDLLVETLARVREKYPKVLCAVGGTVLSGEGIEDTDTFAAGLQRRIRELELEQNILFLGEIDYAPALLARATMYLQPSRSESFCRAVIEAQACGAPVATFAAGALPEVVGEGGVLAPTEDAGALSQHVLRVLDSPVLSAQLRAAGAVNAERFTMSRTTNAFRELLAGVTR